MLSVSITELAERSDDIVAELRAGHSLELIQGGKRFAEITPTEPQPTDEERRAATVSSEVLMLVIRRPSQRHRRRRFQCRC